jgi:ABC-type glycerol-3-phosphate transport system substrate-binding protein
VKLEDLRGTIIHYWHPWNETAGETMKELVDEFNLTNEWGLVVVPVPQAGLDALGQNVAASLQTGQAPDVATGYLHQALAWDATGKVVDLRGYLDDPVWGLSLADQADFYPVFWEQDVVDGKRLGIPALRSGQLLFYNETWARELGYTAAPITPEQFAEQACAAARVYRRDASLANDGSGGWIIATDYPAILGWIYAFGGKVLKEPEPGLDQSAYRFNNPRVEETFTFLRGLFEDGCAWLAPSEYPEEEFAGRLGLFATGSVTDIPFYASAFRRAGNNDRWTALAFPSPGLAPAFDVYGPSYTLLGSSPERQLAGWLFIKWLAAPENQRRMVEATGSFPLNASSLEALEGYGARHPQWQTAVEALRHAQPEPPLETWGTVRWALGDAATQLFRSYFTIDQLPALLRHLDLTAAELHLGPDLESVFATPTSTAATATPTRTPRTTSLTPGATATP